MASRTKKSKGRKKKYDKCVGNGFHVERIKLTYDSKILASAHMKTGRNYTKYYGI